MRLYERLLSTANTLKQEREDLFPALKILSISVFLLIIRFSVRLFLIGNCEAVSTLCSSSGKHKSAALCCHAGSESEFPCSLCLARLVRSFAFVTHIGISPFLSLKADFSAHVSISTTYYLVKFLRVYLFS